LGVGQLQELLSKLSSWRDLSASLAGSSQSILDWLIGLDNEVIALRANVMDLVAATVRSTSNDSAMGYSSSGWSKEELDVLTERWTKERVHLEGIMEELTGLACAQAEIALAATAKAEEERMKLQTDVLQLKPILSSLIPIGISVPIGCISGHDRNCDNIICSYDYHWEVKSSPYYDIEGLETVLRCVANADCNGWFSEIDSKVIHRLLLNSTMRFLLFFHDIIFRVVLEMNICPHF
jgi:hypothetical protein